MGFLGLGDGKLELQLDNTSVTPGQALKGKATLTLNKDVQGKGVVATLWAVRFEWVNRNNTREVTIYKTEQNLDIEKLYSKANSPFQYNFSFAIPRDAIQLLCNHSEDKSVGGLPVSVSSEGTIRWYIDVKLMHEAMLTLPISHKQEVHVVAPTQ